MHIFLMHVKPYHFFILQAVMDSIKSRMSCLSVVTCVWLCSYMNVVGTDARQKPLAMLEHLTRVKIEQATSTER